MEDQLRIVKVSAHSTTPTKGSLLSAGFDLYAAEAVSIAAGGKGIVSTGLNIAVPRGSYGRIAPRSGLALIHHLQVGAGVVDADFRGVVKIILFNHGKHPFVVQIGDRVAQLICEKIYYPQLTEVPDLDVTIRGARGCGSLTPDPDTE